MLLGPIFSVELVSGARRRRYFVLRVLYAVVLLFALGTVYLVHFEHRDTTDIGAVASFAASFFVTFTVIQLVAVVLLAPAMAAGTIAQERERRTIEYLFVSHLTNVEIVLGKLAGRLVQIACLLLAGLPVLSLAGLMGGIAPEALLVAFLITLSTVLTVAILSIAISVWSPRARDAVVRAYLVMLCLFLLPAVVQWTIGRQGWWIWDTLAASVNDQLLAANPFWILGDVIWAAGAGDAAVVRAVVGALVRNHLIVSVVALVAATLAVRRVHLRARSVGVKRHFRLMQWLRPGPGDQPMLWKEVFAEPAVSRLGWLGGIAAVLIALAVIGPTLYWFSEAISRRGWRDPEDFLMFASMIGALVGCGGLLLIAARSATAVTSEKERDSWVSLLSTPMAPRDIVLAKVLGSIYAVRGVFFLLAFVWLLALIVEPGFLISIVFILGTLLLLAFCVSSLGVLLSLWCRNSLRAMAATLAIALFVGGGYLFCCMMMLIASSPGPGDGAQIMLAPCMPYLLAFPGAMYSQGEHFLRHEPAMLAAYVLGIIGYALASLLLIAGAIGNFDQLCGRTGMTPPRRPPRPWPGPPEFVVPEVVEELPEIVDED